MVFNRMFDWFMGLFGLRRTVRLGIYGDVNVGKTTLANKIAKDWTGEEVGKVSVIPHETRVVQKKEKVEIKYKGKKLMINLLDMPGIVTKVDYRDFAKYGIKGKEAKQRAKEATKGVIEAIKWLNNVDTVLAVMDATKDPLTQVNVTLLGNLESRNIPVIIVANKTDLKKSDPDAIKDAFPDYPIVAISALTGKNIGDLYDAIHKYARRAK